MAQEHMFQGELHWGGGATKDTDGKFHLARKFVLRFKRKAPIEGSAPAAFDGDDDQHNPESLMVASLMSDYHLTYIALCEKAKIEVLEYRDDATGTLGLKDGKLRMLQVVLWPQVRVSDASLVEKAQALHRVAHEQCPMANSVNFELRVEPVVNS